MAVNKFGEEIPEVNKNYTVPVEEQETCVNWGRRDDCLTVWTSDKTVMTKLDRMVGNGYWKLVEDCGYCKRYQCSNPKAVSFRTGEKRKSKKEE